MRLAPPGACPAGGQWVLLRLLCVGGTGRGGRTMTIGEWWEGSSPRVLNVVILLVSHLYGGADCCNCCTGMFEICVGTM